MFYIILEINSEGKFVLHICKAKDVDEAKLIADVKRNASYHAVVSKDEVYALDVLDKGCVTKLM